jgi:hypothetical protein
LVEEIIKLADEDEATTFNSGDLSAGDYSELFDLLLGFVTFGVGDHVRITGGTIAEFVGKTGRIIDTEFDGPTVLFRVKLDEPITLPFALTEPVTDDLWAAEYLERVTEPTREQLREAGIDPDEDDPKYPRTDWQYEVTNGDTKLGYTEWLLHKREAAQGECLECGGPLDESSQAGGIVILLKCGGCGFAAAMVTTQSQSRAEAIANEVAARAQKEHDPPIEPDSKLGEALLDDFEGFMDGNPATDEHIAQYLGDSAGAYLGDGAKGDETHTVSVGPRGKERIRELLMRHARRTGPINPQTVPNYEEYENALRIVRAYEDAETAAKVARNEGGAK